MQKKSNEKKLLAIILIIIGGLWLFRQIGIITNFIHFDNLFFPLHQAFRSTGRFIFSFPVILIIVGLILIAGNRKSGWVFITIGGLFLIPEIFHFTGITISLLLPVILICAGIIIVSRL